MPRTLRMTPVLTSLLLALMPAHGALAGGIVMDIPTLTWPADDAAPGTGCAPVQGGASACVSTKGQ